MDTIFMTSENSKTSEYHVLVLQLTDKLDLRSGQKTVALLNLSIYYTWKEFELPDGSYSISDINIKISLNIFKKNIVKVLIIHQLECISIELKIELHLKLKMDIILNF